MGVAGQPPRRPPLQELCTMNIEKIVARMRKGGMIVERVLTLEELAAVTDEEILVDFQKGNLIATDRTMSVADFISLLDAGSDDTSVLVKVRQGGLVAARAMSFAELSAQLSPSGNSYHADPVHWDGTTFFENLAFSCTDSFDAAVVFWFKTSFPGSPKAILVSDPDDAANNLLSLSGSANGSLNNIDFELGDNPFVNTIEPNTVNGAFTNDAWHCGMFAANTNHVPSSAVVKYYIDDAPVAVSALHPGGLSAFKAAFNGLKMLFGTDGGTFFSGDMADFRMILTPILDGGGDIPEATRRLFIDADGKPVDPAIASAALGGEGPLLLTGDASEWTSRFTSYGFSAAAGALTDADTSPSDDGG